ncbi:SLATT domain-containing protein [Micromonospora zhanjiangensis]|uniref:SLATT domain-containing protein n=1 Tax=Micromonospora zhanjiangensis TaxID=1522057 RepID=A0ABV8KWE7_9ACTN
MRWFARGAPPEVTRSENGLYELIGCRVDLPLHEVIVHFRDLVSADITWADSRKDRYRMSSSWVRILSVALAAVSTVVLGLGRIEDRAEIVLPLVATVTVLGTMESFFNWRPRWVTMEETRYRLNKLRDEIDYYLAVTPSTDVTRDVLDRFFEEQQRIWRDVSRRWIELRSLDATEPYGHATQFRPPDAGWRPPEPP